MHGGIVRAMTDMNVTSPIPDNHHVCENCKKIYEKRWTDAEAYAEYARNFPAEAAIPNQEYVFVCDDCYREFIHWYYTLPEAKREMLRQELLRSLDEPI